MSIEPNYIYDLTQDIGYKLERLIFLKKIYIFQNIINFRLKKSCRVELSKFARII